ncbi:MAG: AAA domain-containing protein, partial [Gammaproteobacteria bacterium]|nr:AAA domain-containing protein [Gammaproteobacteria bacterium]
ALRRVGCALELGDAPLDDDRRAVEDYNREDCESTARLQDWLERLRGEQIAHGAEIPRPAPPDGEATDQIKDLDRRLQDLRDRLLKDVPAEPGDRNDDQRARFLLAHLMEFHRRENKAAWWEFFRLKELGLEDYRDERRALADIVFDDIVDPSSAPVLRYTFPPQEVDARDDDEVRDEHGERIGSVAGIHVGEGWIDIKQMRAAASLRPAHVFFHKVIGDDPIRESLVRLGEHVVARGFAAEAPYRSALNLLLRRRPGAASEPLRQPRENTVDAARRIALALERNGDVLAIQGPPGTGKTFTGAEMICALVAAGKRVGVTAVSHKVILNLLEKTAKAAGEKAQTLRIVHKPKTGETTYAGDWPIVYEKRSDKIRDALVAGAVDVVGGTAWLWSRPEFTEAVDVLIVDEAGQMALGNVLAVAPAGTSLVLLGDPQQLEQPLKSSHPEGSDVAALKHWLGDATTMPDDAGLFLETTWRLHPDICAFTSEIYYEGRMDSKPGLERQAVDGTTRFAGSGLRYVPVRHAGNTARSIEEAAAIAQIVDELTSGAAIWNDEDGRRTPVTADDILIVAPYNAQVGLLIETLPMLEGRIGTVDKFQGQEAPIVIYSMTSSSPLDAPRGMEFLYDPNRFNVATSRAKALCILVGNEALLAPQCKTPKQMRMANGFCRYRELASVVEVDR